jgi:thioredoxin reductase (NADPH)
MYDVIVIGAGPAGASAALFTAKARKSTLIIDNDRGVTRRAMIHNHYGVPEITGPALIETGQLQARRLGAEFVSGTARKVTRAGDVLLVEADGVTYEARHVVLATGMAADLAEASGVITLPATEPRVKTVVQVDAAGRTSVPGLWAAGTIAGTSMHTIITAGDGAKVAVNVVSELNGSRWVDHDILPAK